MPLDQAAAEPAVGHHVIEAGHHLALRHDRQPDQVGQLQSLRVQPAQPPGVERRMLGRMLQQHPQPVPLVGG